MNALTAANNYPTDASYVNARLKDKL